MIEIRMREILFVMNSEGEGRRREEKARAMPREKKEIKTQKTREKRGREGREQGSKRCLDEYHHHPWIVYCVGSDNNPLSCWCCCLFFSAFPLQEK